MWRLIFCGAKFLERSNVYLIIKQLINYLIQISESTESKEVTSLVPVRTQVMFSCGTLLQERECSTNGQIPDCVPRSLPLLH